MSKRGSGQYCGPRINRNGHSQVGLASRGDAPECAFVVAVSNGGRLLCVLDCPLANVLFLFAKTASAEDTYLRTKQADWMHVCTSFPFARVCTICTNNDKGMPRNVTNCLWKFVKDR